MDQLRARYDPVLGSAIVDVMERLSLFAVFRSPWFSAGLVVLVVSIIVCTLDRTPRLWRGVSDVRVAQPEPFFDPILPDRAAMDGVAADDVGRVLRRSGFHVREETAADGTQFVYGDRHQYTKMATLLTHLGLILFLIAAAATARLGDEQGLVVAEGQSLTVQPIGTPGLLLVKNIDFEAPGFDTGHPTDFTTDLAVFQDGKQIARKTIRVNDPLSIAGYTFHQNGFGPAPHVVLKTAEGAVLWDAPVPMTDEASGLPYASIGVPGRDMGLKLFLDKDADGNGIVTVVPYTVAGTGADGQPVEDLYQAVDLHQGDVRVSQGLDLSIGLVDFGQFTLLIAKADPGQGIVWIAFASLIAGIAITFYRPRRRVWTRIAPDGRLGIVWRSDRYVDVEREFGRLLDQLVAIRRTG
jgi:cytochrome c biogenesis protein